MKKSNQQSRSGWGGRRAGTGAPIGNTNAVKHGERSRRAFFPLLGGGSLPPPESLRIRNLMIAERVGELWRMKQSSVSDPAAWRELMLLDGIMWQHTHRMARLKKFEARLVLNMSRLELAQTKAQLAQAKAARHSDSKK